MSATSDTEHARPPNDEPAPPREPYRRLFLRFLRFGALAWGGPVAQIAMIRRELVDDERWISNDRFNRTLAVYQVLPGPEAHELCVYFGTLARGRLGGILAGLGFMLPGFVLMFALSWFYFAVGLESPLLRAVFAGFQAAVVALIVRAVHRIGGHALHDRWLVLIAVLALGASLVGVHFAIVLLLSGAAYALVARDLRWPAGLLLIGFVVGVAAYLAVVPQGLAGVPILATGADEPDALGRTSAGAVTSASLFLSGLKAGLLTFGGAYTVIPFLQHDAVREGAWMTNRQFLDGIALSGILPAPLIIFSTFVGYFGGGPVGAIAMTVAIFLPAFLFTLIGHELLERVVANRAVHSLLDGVTAGVVGLISATTLVLFRAAIPSIPALLIFGLALALTYRWTAKAAVAGIVLGAGALGLLMLRT